MFGLEVGVARTLWGRGRLVVSLVALVAVPLLACKQRKSPPDPTPVAAPTVSPNVAKTKELKPKLKKHVEEGIYGLAAKLKKEPKVRANKPFSGNLEDEKYVVVGLPWLEEPDRSDEAGEVNLGDTTLHLCHGFQDDEELSNDQLKWGEECLAWEYAAVVRKRSLKLPKVSKEAHTFDKGSFFADMLLVEIATGSIKGRYLMRITNSDKFTVLDTATEGEIQIASEKDLVENVLGVIGERLRGEIKDMGH